MGLPPLKLPQYPRQNRLQVLQDLPVAEPDDLVALAHEEDRPISVFLGMPGVIGAVNLHNQPGTRTGEVHDIGPDGVLMTELEPRETPQTKRLPQDLLTRGLVMAQGTGDGVMVPTTVAQRKPRELR